MTDESEEEIIARAIHKAREAFDKAIEDTGRDAGYFSLDLKVKFMSADFDEVLKIVKDIDKSRDCRGKK
jgi:hypothetical protein